MQLQNRQSCDRHFGEVRWQEGHRRQELRRRHQGTASIHCRNTDSHTCWSSASPATPGTSRGELTRRSSSRGLESSPSSSTLTRTMSSQPDSSSMISNSRTSRRRTSRPLRAEPLPEKKSERDSQRPTETCPTRRLMTRPITWSSSSAASGSEILYNRRHMDILIIDKWELFNRLSIIYLIRALCKTVARAKDLKKNRKTRSGKVGMTMMVEIIIAAVGKATWALLLYILTSRTNMVAKFVVDNLGAREEPTAHIRSHNYRARPPTTDRVNYQWSFVKRGTRIREILSGLEGWYATLAPEKELEVVKKILLSKSRYLKPDFHNRLDIWEIFVRNGIESFRPRIRVSAKVHPGLPWQHQDWKTGDFLLLREYRPRTAPIFQQSYHPLQSAHLNP